MLKKKWFSTFVCWTYTILRLVNSLKYISNNWNYPIHFSHKRNLVKNGNQKSLKSVFVQLWNSKIWIWILLESIFKYYASSKLLCVRKNGKLHFSGLHSVCTPKQGKFLHFDWVPSAYKICSRPQKSTNLRWIIQKTISENSKRFFEDFQL